MIWENTELVRICISLEYPAKKIYAKIGKKAKNDPSEEKVQKSQKIRKWKFYKNPFAKLRSKTSCFNPLLDSLRFQSPKSGQISQKTGQIEGFQIFFFKNEKNC